MHGLRNLLDMIVWLPGIVKLGPYSLFLIGFHVLFVTLGYAGNDQGADGGLSYGELVIGFPWMLPALVGFLFFMAAGISSYKKAKGEDVL